MEIYRGEFGIGIDVELNTSPFSGYITLAPRMGTEIRHKRGMITYLEYREEYLKRITEEFSRNRQRLASILFKDRLVLTCNCKPYDKSCHNEILVEFLLNQLPYAKYRGIWINKYSVGNF